LGGVVKTTQTGSPTQRDERERGTDLELLPVRFANGVGLNYVWKGPRTSKKKPKITMVGARNEDRKGASFDLKKKVPSFRPQDPVPR